MEDKLKPRIGITVGDLNGIGIEVILKTLNDNRILNYCTPIIYGSTKAISFHRKALNIDTPNYSIISTAEKAIAKSVNVLNCWEEEVNINLGEPDAIIGQYAIKALDKASDDLVNGKIDGMVTGPVNKHAIILSLPDFVGQTEFISNKINNSQPIMILVSGNLRVGLVTGHIPLKEVSAKLSIKSISQKIEIFSQSLKIDFLVGKPKIAILGLNPHAGDSGSLGAEEKELIIPAIEECSSKNILAMGPYSSDGFFGSKGYKQFDGILAMYHDQGLIPFKALAFGAGVNFTGGLPVVRTSPDHGTAYDIAGKGIANESSFREALFLALDIIKSNSDFRAMYKNPLTKSELVREED